MNEKRVRENVRMVEKTCLNKGEIICEKCKCAKKLGKWQTCENATKMTQKYEGGNIG